MTKYNIDIKSNTDVIGPFADPWWQGPHSWISKSGLELTVALDYVGDTYRL